jgi:NADH dehydrogenase FAD-containing subunit
LTAVKENADVASSGRKKRLLIIIGGGATACELGQSLGRLVEATAHQELGIELVASGILPNEDTALQQSAEKRLVRAGIT